MKWLDAGNPSPALLVRPRGAVSLDEAHLAIELWEFYSGKTLDQSQRVAVELMMAEDASGKWAAQITGRCMPRQNGKNDEIEVVEFYGLTQRDEAILHTAHEIPTAKNAHLRMVSLLDHADFRARCDPKFGNGNFEINLPKQPGGHVDRGDPGGIISYRTRTAGGGRGLDDISRLVVDEAQHAQPEQLASASPTLNANPNPQRNLLGTAGIEGRSDWWWQLRRQAIENDDDGFAWFEHSAELVELNAEGRVVSNRLEIDPKNERLWALANPAFPHRKSPKEMQTELKLLGPLFAREHLGVWDPYNDGMGGVVPYAEWEDLADAGSTVARGLAYGLAVAHDGSRAAIGSAGVRPDGHVHVDNTRVGRGTDWIVDHVVDLYRRRRTPMRIDPAGPEGAFIRPLRDAAVEVVEVPSRDYQAACGEWLDRVKNGTLRHLGAEELSSAVAVADRRDIGKEGAWVWASDIDICTLKAATVALSGVSIAGKPAIENVY